MMVCFDNSIEFLNLRSDVRVSSVQVATKLAKNVNSCFSLAIRNEPSVRVSLKVPYYQKQYKVFQTYRGDSGRKGIATLTMRRGITIQARGNLQRNSGSESRTPKLIQDAIVIPRKLAMKTSEKLEPLS